MTSKTQTHDFRTLASAVIDTELKAIQSLTERLDDDFVAACEALLNCQGRVIVTGMGKSGHIGNKIAATLASTGTPAFFVHPGEASHGDLGMIVDGDVIIALSNSGTTDEILSIIPVLKRMNITLIAMTGNSSSALAEAAHHHIDASVSAEACPLGLAPTASTTASLVLGDALAIALLEARGFTADDFARSHPGGRLGKRLLVHVHDLMHTDNAIPKVSANTALSTAILEITQKSLGLTCITDQDDHLLGIFTDGDLRRAFENQTIDNSTIISKLMTHTCQTITPDALAAEALNLMEAKSITVLPVVQNQKIVGIIHMHDLLRAGIA